MKVFMIGGTGLLGSEAAKELIARGHEVSSLALPPLPTGAVLPPEMKLEFSNYLEMSDEELKQHLQGCEGFVFAAGVDERVEGPAPIYDLYKKYNIDPVKRLLGLCRECGVKHVAICGSYFSHAARKWPEKELTKWHPYIKSRIDQEAAAMAFADDMDVAVLELPYIFGTQPGRKPVWVFLVENVMRMKKVTMYPKGGSTMVTVHQVGQAIAGAIEKTAAASCFPKRCKRATGKPSCAFAARSVTSSKQARGSCWRAGTGAPNANAGAGTTARAPRLIRSSRRSGTRCTSRTSCSSTRRKSRSWTYDCVVCARFKISS